MGRKAGADTVCPVSGRARIDRTTPAWPCWSGGGVFFLWSCFLARRDVFIATGYQGVPFFSPGLYGGGRALPEQMGVDKVLPLPHPEKIAVLLEEWEAPVDGSWTHPILLGNLLLCGNR